ncbi:hypothetical protein I4F81_004352 [Pyropia yezoensis]|uniref:Uncharacterized protein n=1 Tax=Pyropia yezoensis TaxID=2788 RepID=A0ACC3BV48_PYRYE|nr:hypothetical protein I4F81_004352 [Neopyropia yezoensis]
MAQWRRRRRWRRRRQRQARLASTGRAGDGAPWHERELSASDRAWRAIPVHRHPCLNPGRRWQRVGCRRRASPARGHPAPSSPSRASPPLPSTRPLDPSAVVRRRGVGSPGQSGRWPGPRPCCTSTAASRPVSQLVDGRHASSAVAAVAAVEAVAAVVASVAVAGSTAVGGGSGGDGNNGGGRRTFFRLSCGDARPARSN